MESSDLRNAAIHECGHAIVARHYGIYAIATIKPNPTNIPREFKTWGGTTNYNPKYLTPLSHRRLAIAGNFAELIASAISTSDCCEGEVYNHLLDTLLDNYEWSDGWSRTDWEGAQGWTDSDVHAVYLILQRNWKTVIAEAELLIASAIEDKKRPPSA